MNADFIREAGKSYMKMVSTERTDKKQMKMISRNKIDGFLQVSIRIINNEEQYLYDISSMMPVTEAFDKCEMRFDDIRNLVNGIKKATDMIQMYMLEQEGLILCPEGIFYDAGKENYGFCYFSGAGGIFEEDMKELFEYVIRNVCHSDNAAVTLAYGAYKRICAGNVNPDKLLETEHNEKSESYQIIEEETVIEDVIPEREEEQYEEKDKAKLYFIYGLAAAVAVCFVLGLAGIFVPGARIWNLNVSFYAVLCAAAGIILYTGYKWYDKNKEGFIKIVTEKKKIPYCKTEVRLLMPEEKTVREKPTEILNLGNAAPTNNSYIKWEDGKETHKYFFEKDICIIGSAREKADCVIDMPGVSRMHARITKEGNTYYVKDLNSTNGTYVRGRQLASFEICRINHNDIIVFGNVECVFI